MNTIRDCAIITWRGGWETRGGGHRGKITTRKRGGWMSNLIHTRVGALLFSQTGKVVEELLEFKHLYLLTLELNWENINPRRFHLSSG